MTVNIIHNVKNNLMNNENHEIKYLTHVFTIKLIDYIQKKFIST